MLNKTLLSGIFITLIFTSSLASAQEANIIPPTNALEKLNTSNGTLTAKNYTAAFNMAGKGGTTITESSNSNTIYINSTGLSKIQGANLGTSGIPVFAGNFNSSELQFYQLISGNSNCVLSSNSTNDIITCTGSGGSVTINGNTGSTFTNVANTTTTNTFSKSNNFTAAWLDFYTSPIILTPHRIIFPSSNSGTICLTNQTSTCGLTGSHGTGIIINSNNRTTFTNIANTTSANNFTSAYLNFINQPIILTPHRVTFPTTNSGIVCLTNQTSSCGPASGAHGTGVIINGNNRTSFIGVMNSTNAAGHGIIINANNRTSFISVANTTSANTINTHSVSFPSTHTGTLLLSNETFSGTIGTILSSTFGWSGHTYTLPSNTGTFCLTNQTASCGTASALVTINANQRSSFISVANTTSANTINTHSVSFPSSNSGTILLSNGTFTGTHSSGSISSAVTVTSVTSNTHVVTFPNNATGTFCLINQTNQCGKAGTVSINGVSRSSFVSVANTTSANTINTHSVSFASNQTGTLCERNQTGTCGQIKVNSNIRNYVTGVANTTAANTFTANNDLGQGTTQTFPNSGLKIRNTASTFTTAIQNGAQTLNNTISIPVIPAGTSQIDMVPFYNFTSQNKTTGTTSVGVQQMYGGGVTFSPRVGTNATVSVSFITQDSTLGDGCKTDIRWGTGGVHGTNSALAGTLVGSNMKSVSPTTASLPQSQGKTVQITGLTAGTKYYADLSYSVMTGGTCQVYNVDWYVMAP